VGEIMKYNKDLMQLVDDLNKLNIDNSDNTFVTNPDWNFVLKIDNEYTSIELHGVEVLGEFHEDSTMRSLYLEDIKNELESWLPALQSAIWSVGKLLKKEK
jgi:hypothetical protein